MSAEEGLQEAIMAEEEILLTDPVDDEDEDEEEPSVLNNLRKKRLRHRNRAKIEIFLGEGITINESAILPSYYGELLTWAVHQYLEREGWNITATLGYHDPVPVFINVETGSEVKNVLKDGQMFVIGGDNRIIITVDINPGWRGAVTIEGPATIKSTIEKSIASILAIVKTENFYRGNKIEYSGRIRFLDIKDRSWDSIVLDSDIKAEIKANTVSFLKRSKQWIEYGIPRKRGVLLAGDPGTGKTVVCKALMAEAEGVTCINTNAYALDSDEYITDLYELAQDLSPSIVFIEDIDLIGQNRMEFGYLRGPSLLSLLSVMDGIEGHDEIVTVATSNCLETLDKALSERPSRFDRVIRFTRPSMEQRRDLVRSLCGRIPLNETIQNYIAVKAENCTPAQLQEMVYSLVIQCHEISTINKSDIDKAASRINGYNRCQLGFNSNGNHNGHKPECNTTIV
ncbi:AAA family ATPase [Chloroflexota bacterium]